MSGSDSDISIDCIHDVDNQDWDDFEDEQPSRIICPVCSEYHTSVKDCVEHLLKSHGFDLLEFVKSVSLNNDDIIYNRIKIINYIRTVTNASMGVSEKFTLVGEDWKDDKYFIPVLPDDEMLYDYEDELVENEETETSDNIDVSKLSREELETLVLNLQNELKETKRYYADVIETMKGRNKEKTRYRVLKIDRTSPIALSIVEDTVDYTYENVETLLRSLDLINKTSGGVRKVGKGHLILGFIRFLHGYYFLYVTKKKAIAHINKHAIYSVDDLAMYYIPNQSYQIQVSSDEEHYRNTFRGLDLSKDFYFSYVYDITNSLQRNMTKSKNEPCDKMKHFNDIFVWNHYLIQPLISSLQEDAHFWTFPIICGSIVHRKVDTLGARFLKRGLNEQGYVANDVETEQILFDSGKGIHSELTYSSFVQHRGTIPLYWAQINHGVMPKPPIVIQRTDPFYRATILHFMDLYRRYGNPLIVLNLIKSKENTPREMLLRDALSKAIDQINLTIPDENKRLMYIGWDFKKAAKSNKSKLQRDMYAIAQITLNKIGFFHSGKPMYVNKVNRNDLDIEVGGINYRDSEDHQASYGRFQCGTIRTNCIDSLDRTNAAQYLVGLCSLSHQLHAMGLIQNPLDITFDSEISLLLMEMYEISGHQLAIQYGGSGLAHTINTFGAKSLVDHSKDFWTVVQRYYRNAFTDQEKQNSINLFLGIFRPYEETVNIWSIESDYHLHMKNCERELLYTMEWWKEPLEIFYTRLYEREKDQEIKVEKYEETPKYLFFDKLFADKRLIIKTVPIGKTERTESTSFALTGIRRWLSTAKEDRKVNYIQDNVKKNDREYFIPSPPFNPLGNYGMLISHSKHTKKILHNYTEVNRLDRRLKKKRNRYSYYTTYYRATHYKLPTLYKNFEQEVTTRAKPITNWSDFQVKEEDVQKYQHYIACGI